MTNILWRPVFRYSAFIIAAVAAALFAAPYLGSLFDAVGLPHATCYLQNPRMIWLHASSDTIIGAAYLSISSTLGYLVYRARRDIPFHWMFMAFGLFIVTCGFTHFMEVWTVWQPVYWLAGYLKLITAVASLATAIVLPPVVPKVIRLIQSAKVSEERGLKLESANRELEGLYSRLKQMDELKSQFFANVSHELRTPLTLIIAPSQKLMTAVNLSSEQQQDIATILRNARALLRQVNELLDAAKLEAGKMAVSYQRIDLAQLMRVNSAQFESVAQSRMIEFKRNIPETLEAEIDIEKVERILLNLLSNAFKFVPDSGRVSCTLEHEGDSAVIKIGDSGPGIPLSMRKAVFERFRQLDGAAGRRHGGTGLGLAISQEFAALLRGKIEVKDAPEGGALFIVQLPLKAPEGTAIEAGEHQYQSEAAGLFVAEQLRIERVEDATEAIVKPDTGTVLVVEDNPELNAFVSAALRKDYQVARAHDGAEALAMLKATHPDVVVSDMMMPGVTGDELLKKIRSQSEHRYTPFIFLTAKADEEVKLRLLRAGAQDFMTKPFVVEELRARVSNLVSINRTRRLLQEALQRPGDNINELVNEALERKSQAEVARATLRELNETLEHRVAERTAELAEANLELKAFTSSVSHDLRAPLRTMRGMAEVLRETVGDSNPEVTRYASRIMSAAQKMDTLLNDLLAYASLGRGEIALEPVNLDSVVAQVVGEFGADIDQRKAQLEVTPGLPTVTGNTTMVKQIVSNLVGNGLKYVPPGQAPRVNISTEIRGSKVRLWVEDNGLGIEPEYQEKIFEPFKRLHSEAAYSGTGLGLSIVLKAVHRMGGEVGVESEPGRGSRFWVDLPKA